MAYNGSDSEVLCMGHPHAISQLMSNSNTYNTLKSYSNDSNYNYKQMIYDIELKSCKIMQYNQIFLFPYVFENGFPIVKGAGGVLEFY